MISIVTCWLDHPELIPAYEAAVAGSEIIVVDQASDADTYRALEKVTLFAAALSSSRVLRMSENIHFAAGNNRGLAEATCDVVVMLNNDVVGAADPPNAWLEQVAEQVKPGGFYGPSLQFFDVDGEAHPYLEGWCIAASRETWNAIGGWDAVNYPRAYAEDVDLCWRARVAGLSLYQTRWPIQHLGNVTNSQLADGYTYADQQREVFRNRVRAWKARKAA